jgi:IPT/TIG domain
MTRSGFLLSALVLSCIEVLTLAGCGGGTKAPPDVAPSSNPAPAIAAITPSSAMAGSAATSISITGTGFISSSLVQWNGAPIATTYSSPTSVNATLPAINLANGVIATVTVANPSPGGGTSAAVQFAVNNPSPIISKISPVSIVAGSGDTTLDISGSGFVPSTVIDWNGAALVTTFASETELKAVLPAVDVSAATQAEVTATNPPPVGGTSAQTSFVVGNPLPTITSVSPASAVAGATATTLDIKGANFLAGSVVAWNNTPLVTKFVSSTEISAVLSATQLSGSSESLITVQNPAPGGGVSAAATFDVNSPVAIITSISPRIVPPGSAATITITGTGFESNSVVLWNAAARPTTFMSNTVLQVALSAADLQKQGTGSLQVNNPGPATSTSSSIPLTVTSQPIPVIQSVSITNAPGFFGGCPQLQVSITGQNFTSYSKIQANGTPLENISYNEMPTTLINYLPVGFVSKPGALSFTVTNPEPVAVVSDPFPYPATSAPALALCATPSPTTVYTGTNFSFTVQPSEVNVSGNGNLTLGSLPAGITATTSSATMPSGGATFHLKAAGSAAAGTYDLSLTGTAATATATGDFNFTVSTGAPPNFSFISPLSTEVGVPIGGSGSIQYGTVVSSNSSVDFDITPSVSGLPPGTTAAFSPSVFSPGQNVTVTLTAAGSAPVTQNAPVTLTGTASAQVPSATATFLADVTQPPGSLPGSRTDFVSTAGTPYAAAYDATHNLIFSSNPDWNRVDVISNATHKLVKSIPVLSPQGLDITPDNSRVWVGTGSQRIYAIDTSQLTATQAVLPRYQNQPWVDYQLETLSDGTLLLSFGPGIEEGIGYVAVWNPTSNTLTGLPLPSNAQPGLGWGPLSRSGDGSKVYSFNANSTNCQVLVYDVASKTVTAPGAFDEVCGFYAVNQDGSRLVGSSGAAVGLYDGSFNLLGTILPSNPAVYGYFEGSFIFSHDGSTLYEISQGRLTTIDTATLKVLGTAPAISTLPVGVSETPISSIPIAVDANQMLLGIQDFGIAFEDTAFYQNYGSSTTTAQIPVSLTPYSGSLSGGTQVSPYGYFDLTPDVWFGGTRATSVVNENLLTITSPPSSVAGPVNLKYLFPDGSQIFAPQVFSYSVYPQYAVLSGATPDGGVPGRITGYGMPADAGGGTLTVGGNSATITTTDTQYLPFTGEPFPTTNFNFTVPSGTPGLADIVVTTPAGTGTLPKAMLYAKSVTDYSSSDTFTSVLLDAQRNQVYLTAGDHVDVFSTTSNQYVAPLDPPAAGTVKQFSGLALTPDDSQLLVTDLKDGSLAVINPDSPGNAFTIPIAPEYNPVNNCVDGPLYVAATSNHQAFVSTGSLPALSCNAQGYLYLANLQTRTAAVPSTGSCGGGAASTAASSDGNSVVIDADGSGSCIFSTQTGTYTPAFFGGTSVEISGDANVLASDSSLADGTGSRLGRVAAPVALYQTQGSYLPIVALSRPRLNAAGSLYFVAYPNYFEIIDVLHGRLMVRFSLNETIQNTASPLAIDSGGQHVYLLTDKGLTVVDLGEAPLSIGHLSQTNTSPGTQITVRGSGFDAGTTGTVGGVAASVSFTDQNTLTLTIPSGPPGPEDIILTRSDGETYTLENGVVLP